MSDLFLPFKTIISEIKPPEKFTYPFNYVPHKLSEIASKELQIYIDSQTEWNHNFGLNKVNEVQGIGKMFGVLVCQNTKGELGQLWAFSGKLAEGNQWTNFVPTVFDMLTEEGFYKQGEALLNSYNTKIKALKNNEEYVKLLNEKEIKEKQSKVEINAQKERIKVLKHKRDQLREKAMLELSHEELTEFNYKLSEQSKKENISLKKINKYWKNSIFETSNKITIFETKINALKKSRKKQSAHLQQQLFKEYTFLNIKRETKNLGEIFDNNPPAGAGECCAPKLLHYAFKYQLKPIAMAEFWWGKSPNSEIRKHQFFYPSCRSKCEPILLKHMLTGMNVDENPLEIETIEEKSIKIIFEDQWISIIHKPYNLLSVPGKRIKDSVYTRVSELYPKADGPLIVHRLDRATSGLMIIAKDLDTYINLQRQFTARTVKKKYVALLDGILKHTSRGIIDLPLRVDLDNRPQQLICYEYGKEAITKYEVKEIKEGKTIINFYPITGRTHQLRVHSSHSLGLNIAIVGDDLYGKKSDRLYLHAEWMQFEHPQSKNTLEFELEANF